MLILPLPAVTHEAVLERALSGRRPFDQDGRTGYRDALIWHTVLELAQTTTNVVLVSNDGDFADSTGELLASLRDETSAAHSTSNDAPRVALCKDLRQLIGEFFDQQSGLLFELNERLRTDRRFFGRVREQLDRARIGSYPDLDVATDIDLEWTDHELELVDDVFDDFVAVFATDVGDGKAFVELRAHADVQLSYAIPLSSAITPHGEVSEGVEWHEGQSSGKFVDVIPATLSIEGFYLADEGNLEAATLVRVTESWEWVEEGRTLGDGPPSRA